MLNRVTGGWEYAGNRIESGNATTVAPDESSYGFSMGVEDLALNRAVSGKMSNYYDENGWVTVQVENSALQNSSLLTDQFSLAFSRTLTTVTDVNGAYSFPSLPDGNYTLTFSKTGYATEIASGTLSPGQIISRGSGIARAPVIGAPSPLPPGVIGRYYNQPMTATDGAPPYTWSVVAGSLPTGLSLDAVTGSISGTPVSEGNASFTVQVKDSINTASVKEFSLLIGSGSISGTVSDAETGLSLAGVSVTLNLTGMAGKDPADRVYACNNVPLTAAEYAAVAANDQSKFSCLTGGTTNSMLFKVRNPFGVDSFTNSWNGMQTTYFENIAQSFKPAVSGNLTKVSFYLANIGRDDAPTGGELHLQLKTALGGDAGTQLAESASIPIESITQQWVEFVFPNPSPITAGQEYYLEIQGRIQRGSPGVWWQFAPVSVSWGNGASYTAGGAYSRRAGLWSPLDTSLAFRTFVNDAPDISVDPAADNTTTGMYGIIEQYARMSILNLSTGNWESGGSIAVNPGYLDQLDGGFSYRGDDLTIGWTVNSGLDRYYDPNGWVTVRMDSFYAYWWDPLVTSLVTDQFSLTFNRILSTVTDANGAYSFPSLPDGAYTLTFEQAAYETASNAGKVALGQNLTINGAMRKKAPASLQGIVRLSSGEPLSGILVTVIDPLGNRSAITDASGNYLVTGIIPGNYTVTFTGAGLSPLTQTGSLSSGQTGVVNPGLNPAPITLTINAPSDGAVISSLPLEVTGSVSNADTITVNAVNDGVMTSYPATITNGTYSVSIPLNSGQTRILVEAANRFSRYLEKSATVTRAPFTVRSLGDTGNVTVMEASGNYDAKTPDGAINDQPRQAIAKEYYKTHGDLDFLVMLTTFDHAMLEATADGFYSAVKNDTLGINQPIMDNTALYGSMGKLQGTIDLGNVTALAASPNGPKLDDTLTVLSHELMHRFGAYVRYKNADGTLNTALLGKDSAHWSYLLDSKGSVMYGNGWKDNGDGTFTSISAKSGYSPLDLYLMGMIPKEQVPAMLLIDNPAIDKTKLPVPGATISGTAKSVTIDDIIAAEGPRVPDAATSQKKFNVGFVLLTRAGDSSVNAAAAIEIARKAFAGRFAELTQGKGSVGNIPASLEIAIDSPANGATITGPDVTVQGSIINTSGAETGVTVNGIPAAISGSRFIVNHVPLQSGAHTITVTATDVNGLTATATKSITTQAGHYIRIVPNVNSGTAPLNLSIRLKSNFNISAPTIATEGPVPVTLTQGESPTEFTTKLTAEGTYTITATATGPDSQSYSDSIIITVISKTRLENLLNEKWGGIKARIMAKDIEGAVLYFPASSQAHYRELFTALGERLSVLGEDFSQLKLGAVTDSIAKTLLLRQETVLGQQKTVGYLVFFVKENGIWKLRQL